VLLDGAIGGEIHLHSPKEVQHHWSNAAFLGTSPSLLREIHCNYFKAGSQIATTNSYRLTKRRLAPPFEMPHTVHDMRKMAVEAARDSRQENCSGLVAGSLGPLFNSYRPDQDNLESFEDQVQQYVEYIVDLSDTDVLLFETVASLHHANVVLEAVKQAKPKQPAWISITVDDENGLKLRSGELVTDVRFIAESKLIEAILVNCSKPEAITNTLSVFREFGIPFGAYANGLTDVDAFVRTLDYSVVSRRADLLVDVYAEFVMEWIKHGATIVGGCCDIGPKHIEAIASKVASEGYELSVFPLR